MVELTIEAAAGRVPVISGTGSNSTEEALLLSRHAKQAGANGLLIGIYQHFRPLDRALGIPIIVYNIPPKGAVGAVAAADQLTRTAQT